MTQPTLTQAAYDRAKQRYDARYKGVTTQRSEELIAARTALLQEEMR